MPKIICTFVYARLAVSVEAVMICYTHVAENRNARRMFWGREDHARGDEIASWAAAMHIVKLVWGRLKKAGLHANNREKNRRKE